MTMKSDFYINYNFNYSQILYRLKSFRKEFLHIFSSAIHHKTFTYLISQIMYTLKKKSDLSWLHLIALYFLTFVRKKYTVSINFGFKVNNCGKDVTIICTLLFSLSHILSQIVKVKKNILLSPNKIIMTTKPLCYIQSLNIWSVHYVLSVLFLY